jgi:hypothetical protein
MTAKGHHTQMPREAHIDIATAAIDLGAVVAALKEQKIEATRDGDLLSLTILADGEPEFEERVLTALEHAVAQAHAPSVPEATGLNSYVIRPPAA